MAPLDIYTERLAVSLFLASMIHLVIIYGVGFILPKSAAHPLLPTMEVILVQKKTELAPHNPDYLAQAMQEGGSEVASEARPATPTIAPFPNQEAKLTAMPPPPQLATAPAAPQTEFLTTSQPSRLQMVPPPQSVTPPEEIPTDQGDAEETTDLAQEKPLSTSISDSIQAVASLQAELSEQFETYAKHPRIKYINASTQESKYASYLEAWRRRIEPLGKSNYPKQAISRKLEGRVILKVGINADGTLHGPPEIVKTSGHRLLDEATLRVLRLAAPFPPFPLEIRKETDLLYITRTYNWEFVSRRLTAKE